MQEPDLEMMIKAAILAILIFLAGFALGRFTSPGMDFDWWVQTDRAHTAQISACAKDFNAALELYKNTNHTAFAKLDADHERALAAIKSAHDDDLRVLKMAVLSCDKSKDAH